MSRLRVAFSFMTLDAGPLAAHVAEPCRRRRRGGQWPQRGRRAIATNLRLSDLLVRGKMVTAEAIERAMERQARYPGRLTDCLVATGGISREKLETFLERIPKEPARLADAGVDAA